MDYAEDTQKEESKQIKMEKYNWEIVEISIQIGILNVSADISAFFFILSLYSLSLCLFLFLLVFGLAVGRCCNLFRSMQN